MRARCSGERGWARVGRAGGGRHWQRAGRGAGGRGRAPGARWRGGVGRGPRGVLGGGGRGRGAGGQTLGGRRVGEVTRDRLETLRAADAIARAELTAAGLDAEIWQCPVVLLADVRSVGVQGDGRTYGHPIVLRPVSSEDAMTADWTRVPYDVLARISNKITNQVPEVNRVVLDVTSKPPGTIEWE